MMQPSRKLLKSAGGGEPSNKGDENCVLSCHPLRNHLVLKEVFGYLSQPNLKCCRLVCRFWREEALKLFAERSTVRFSSEEVLMEFLDLYREQSPQFTRYIFLESRPNPSSPILQEFMERFGQSHVKYFQFDSNLIPSKEGPQYDSLLRHLINVEEMVINDGERFFSKVVSLQVKLPHLKVFRCQLDPFGSVEMQKGINVLTHLLKAAPNITTLSTPVSTRVFTPWLFDNSGSRYDKLRNIALRPIDQHMGAFSTAVIQNEELLNPKCFSHLELALPLRNVHLLTSRNFQLKSLTLSFDKMGLDEAEKRVLDTLYSQVCHSLVKLRIVPSYTYQCSKKFPDIAFHSLNSMKKLELNGGWDGATFSNFNLPPESPLETLKLVDCILPNSFRDTVIPPSLLNLRDLILHETKVKGVRKSESLLVMKACNSFPFLRRMKVEGISDSSLKLICTHLNLLEELYMLDSKVTDFGVTGASKSFLKNNISFSTYKEHIEKKQSPCIGNLINLRILEIGSATITNHSIQYGILTCSSLRRLTIYSPKMTGKGLRSLVDNMGLVYLRTICSFSICDSSLEYARRTLKNTCQVILNAEKGPKTEMEKELILRRYGKIQLLMLESSS